MLYDAAVIGAGPAGITAALYLVRAGARTALVENAAPGGQMLDAAEIENYPGFPRAIKGWELADLFDGHLANYPVERLRGKVVAVARAEDGVFSLRTEENSELSARTVLVCSGARHRKLGIPGEEEFSGRGVSYCAVCDGNFYRGRDVVVVGGGNSALGEALYLSRIARKVFLIHRRESFRGNQIYVDKVRAAENIEIMTDVLPEEIRGSAAGMEDLLVRHRRSGERRLLAAEGIFIYVGMDPDCRFLPEEIQRDPAGFILTDAEMNTTLSGVFAAGDIRSKHCRQICTAVGDGATAAAAALSYLEHLNA